MKSVIAVLLVCLVASTAAFAPLMMATKKVASKAELRSKSKLAKKVDFLYDDGLTVIERDQRNSQPSFLSGAARSQIDESAIRDDLDDVGNSWSLTSQQTLIANTLGLVVLLAIVRAGGGF